jgi:DNA topoisomerase-1
LPSYNEGDHLEFVSAKPEQHFTQPPARYTDASLIKKMEELGVGRPSTYAPTIQTIQARGYVTREGRSFVPTDVAYVVVDLLVENFPQIIDYNFTATLEQELDEIAEGQRKWEPVIKEFYAPFEKIVKEKDKVLSKADVTNLGQSDEKCPSAESRWFLNLVNTGNF